MVHQGGRRFMARRASRHVTPPQHNLKIGDAAQSTVQYLPAPSDFFEVVEYNWSITTIEFFTDKIGNALKILMAYLQTN